MCAFKFCEEHTKLKKLGNRPEPTWLNVNYTYICNLTFGSGFSQFGPGSAYIWSGVEFGPEALRFSFWIFNLNNAPVRDAPDQDNCWAPHIMGDVGIERSRWDHPGHEISSQSMILTPWSHWFYKTNMRDFWLNFWPSLLIELSSLKVVSTLRIWERRLVPTGTPFSKLEQRNISNKQTSSPNPFWKTLKKDGFSKKPPHLFPK